MPSVVALIIGPALQVMPFLVWIPFHANEPSTAFRLLAEGVFWIGN